VILRELFVKLGLDVDSQSFTKGLLAAEGIKLAMSKLADYAHEAKEKLFELVNKSVELDRAAQSAGMTTTALQELRFAADRSGVGVDTLRMSIGRLAVAMVGAKDGSGQQAELFKKMGINVVDANGKLKDTDEILMEIADSFHQMENGAEKIQLAKALFGKGGDALIPMLNKGREGLNDLRKDAIVLDKQTIATGKRIALNIKEYHHNSERFWNDILKRLMPTLEKFTIFILKAQATLGDMFQFLHDNWESVRVVLAGLTVWLAIFKSEAIATAAATAASWIVAAAPFIAIGAAITALLLIFDDLRVYANGGKSLFGRFANYLQEWMKPQANDPWWLAAIKAVVRFLDEADDALAKFVYDLVNAPWDLVKRIGDVLGVTDLMKAGENLGDWAAGGRPEGATRQRGFHLPASAIPGGGGNTSNRSATINVYQSPGQSPQEVAEAINQKLYSDYSDAASSLAVP
jgi:hypothetical protein